MDSYNKGIEVVASTYDFIDGKEPNNSRSQTEDAKRTDNYGIEINQGIFTIQAETMDEKILKQLTTFEKANRIMNNYKYRKTSEAEKVRLAEKMNSMNMKMDMNMDK